MNNNLGQSLNQRKDELGKITVHLSSPESILLRSRGEVLKPETINYRSYKPEKDGLFCEKIFGPVKDYECHCGKYKRIRYKGIICDRCGVEVARKKVRRERMGHITLAVPVVHIWFLKSIPSKINNLLGIKTKQLEEIVYYEKYVVLNPGQSEFKYKDVITEEEYYEMSEKYGPQTEYFDDDDADYQSYFIAKTGGEAIRELLQKLDIEKLVRELKKELKVEKSKTAKAEMLKRLKIIKSFMPVKDGPDNKAEWMVVTILPVIPPELRPLVPLEGGRFAASDLNDLYRRVIIRNNRLKQLIEIKAPEVILRNEKRMLQEAVDSLFDNSKRRTEVRSGTRRPLKSLSDMLKGKEGRFRQNLLGKRVDYSGRSVIVVGPDLKLNECGIPKEMAIELFKPHIIFQLIRREIAKTPKAAKSMVERKTPEVYKILEYVVKDHPVLLNRAPTLHRLGIQAFQPILINGKAIQLHPLVCSAFNADFDGDQMAVHVPLSYEAQEECRILILASHNILHPAHGKPVATPSQDMVLGCYYITRKKNNAKGEGKIFSSIEEAIYAYHVREVELHAKVKIRIPNGDIIDTTVGRALFNSIVPEGVGYINELLTKGRLKGIIGHVYAVVGNYDTVKFLDALKNLGFYYAMKSGISMAIVDVLIPPNKDEIIKESFAKVDNIQAKAKKGILTEGERYNKVIDTWTHTTNRLSEEMLKTFEKHNQGFNSLFMMADSGARGSQDQIKQLAAMRGLMAKPQKSMSGQVGEIIETPIISNFKEGLTVLEYFISTHGARKGLADTALKTADAGYLTRRLVDVSQDVVIFKEDCGTINGIEVTALKKEESVIERLADRILGRTAQEDVYNPETDEIIVEVGQEINEEKALNIERAGIESVRIRSVLTCESKFGVCALCYGRNLATGNLTNIGESVGIMAAQAIGEPGTQLTLRTFHMGGTAARIVEESDTIAKTKGIVKFSDNFRELEYEGKDYNVVLSRNTTIEIIDDNDRITSTYNIPYGSHVFVKQSQKVDLGDMLFTWDLYSDHILAMQSGKVRFVDLIEEETYKIEADESGHKSATIIDAKNRNLQPRLDIVVEENGEEKVYEGNILPLHAMLSVQDGDEVKAGDTMAKKPKESGKSADITGGLPRVAELFEARKPKNPAVITDIDGTIKFGETKKGIREIYVIAPDDGTKKKYKMPYGRYVLINEGDMVKAGDRLCEGPVSPRDILKVQDPRKVQEYLVNEIQEVYRLQGVAINDKHIEIIVKQMMQKVKIIDPGDTDLLEEDIVSKNVLLMENEKSDINVVVSDVGESDWDLDDIVTRDEFTKYNRILKEDGKVPAKARPAKPAQFTEILLGITRASLGTESFISAASFQETTRVLTDAATATKTDNLRGLKENVIMGRLIPAGTGLRRHRDLMVLEPDRETSEWEMIHDQERIKKEELDSLKK